MKLGTIAAELEASGRSREFAQYCVALMKSNGNQLSARESVGFSRLPRRVQDALKADVPAHTTTGDASDLAPFQQLAQGFTSTLVNSCFDSVLADSVQAPMHVQFAITVADASGSVAGQGLAKKVSTITLGTGTLQERRAAVLIAVSDDLLKFSTAAGLLENSLRNAIAASVDKIFIDDLVANTTPVAATGTTAADVLHDLRVLMDATGSGSNSQFHLVTGVAVARRLALMASTAGEVAFPTMTTNGGTIAGVRVHVSDALTTAAVLLDASQIVMAADATAIRISPNAALELDDAPAMASASGSPEAPVAASGTVVSMFQTNSTAILCERRIAFQPLRATAVQSLSGVAWGLVGSPPA